MKIVDRNFFCQPALELVFSLLGKIICRKTDNDKVIRLRITEVEAYVGCEDSACHASKGLTKRTAPLFKDGGILYVYLCYGIFNLLNIVSGKENQPEAILIRGVGRVEGPGRVSRALEITRSLNEEDLTVSPYIWIEDDGFKIKPEKIKRLKRVGIDYARQEDREKLWRFKI